MAEGYFRALAGEHHSVVSAGVAAAGIYPMTVAVMSEEGIDISSQYSKSVDELDLKSIDYLVTLCGHARDTCPVFPRTVPTEHWPIDDPIQATGSTQERTKRFRATRDEIHRRVADLVERLRKR